VRLGRRSGMCRRTDLALSELAHDLVEVVSKKVVETGFEMLEMLKGENWWGQAAVEIAVCHHRDGHWHSSGRGGRTHDCVWRSPHQRQSRCWIASAPTGSSRDPPAGGAACPGGPTTIANERGGHAAKRPTPADSALAASVVAARRTACFAVMRSAIQQAPPASGSPLDNVR